MPHAFSLRFLQKEVKLSYVFCEKEFLVALQLGCTLRIITKFFF
ncbi:hypothetical protein APHCR_0934 [Anaplasma phagocytophilum str. CR1007]|nr:hypothetical protein APHWEB_0551 [Anaplasma phagocytophilum str. Webster]KJV99606.1 hypothetical protein OTSANNIE_0141 [Anaplasma phagocytophilum str. Annie]KJZ98820.1 hypothetical protein APHCR_0934 [Anaplasma phagocytophilum str. CR1007]